MNTEVAAYTMAYLLNYKIPWFLEVSLSWQKWDRDVYYKDHMSIKDLVLLQVRQSMAAF